MVAKPHILLALLAVVACTESVLVPNKPPHGSYGIRIRPNTQPPQTPGQGTGNVDVTRTRESTTSTTTITTTTTVTNTGQPNPTEPSAGEGEGPTKESTSSSTQDAIGSNPGEEEPPLFNQVFTTDAATGHHNLTLPEDKPMSSLHFWSPTNGTSLSVTLISSTRNFTRHLTTIMPRHWHSIDIYQPREGSPVQLHFRPDLRYITMEHSRVGQIQASSEDLVHWFFCPNAYMCALPAAEEPAEGTTYAPGEREGLVAALVVVVLLLVASLVALAAVTFYRKAELFHIYAKPIDCLPKGPPPLPKANMQSTPRLDTRTDTKQAEAQNGAAVTGQEDNAKSNTADREVGQGSAAKSRPSSLTYPPVAYVPLKVDHESINSLYGLI